MTGCFTPPSHLNITATRLQHNNCGLQLNEHEAKALFNEKTTGKFKDNRGGKTRALEEYEASGNYS